jgi:hypothetical protein
MSLLQALFISTDSAHEIVVRESVPAELRLNQMQPRADVGHHTLAILSGFYQRYDFQGYLRFLWLEVSKVNGSSTGGQRGSSCVRYNPLLQDGLAFARSSRQDGTQHRDPNSANQNEPEGLCGMVENAVRQ